MSGLRLPPPQTPRELYRHLLREATYLPPAVRPFFENRIRTRFRRNKNDPNPADRLSKATKDLRYLRAANAGDYERMRRVLMLGFGRIGRRRRELVDDLVQKAKPADTAELENFIAEARDNAVGHNDWLGKWNTAKVLALTRSQSSISLPETPLPTSGARTADPATGIPTENIWGRPIAPKLARSKLRKAYKATIKRLLPPVEEQEWELLKQLATGVAGPEWDTPSRRRTVAMPATQETKVSGEWEWEDYLLKPVRAVDAKRSRRIRTLAGEVDETSPYARTALGMHTFTKRLFQRLYTDIWRMTPKMEAKPGPSQKWEVVWGVMKRDMSKGTEEYAEFFEGLPTDTPGPSKGKSKKKPKVKS